MPKLIDNLQWFYCFDLLLIMNNIESFHLYPLQSHIFHLSLQRAVSMLYIFIIAVFYIFYTANNTQKHIMPSKSIRRRSKSQLITSSRHKFYNPPNFKRSKTPKHVISKKRKVRKRSSSAIPAQDHRIWRNKKGEWKKIINQFSQSRQRSMASLLNITSSIKFHQRSTFNKSKSIYQKSIELIFLKKLQNQQLSVVHSKNENNESQYQVSRKNDLKKEEWIKAKKESEAINEWINDFERDSNLTFRSFESFAMSKLNKLNQNEFDFPMHSIKRLKVGLCCVMLQRLLNNHLSAIHPKLKHSLMREIFDSIYSNLKGIGYTKLSLHRFNECIPYFIVDTNISSKQSKPKIIRSKSSKMKRMELVKGAFRTKKAFNIMLRYMKDNNSLRSVLIKWKKQTVECIQSRNAAVNFCHSVMLKWKQKDVIFLFKSWKNDVRNQKFKYTEASMIRMMDDIKLHIVYNKKAKIQLEIARHEIDFLSSKVQSTEDKNITSEMGKNLIFPKRLQTQRQFQTLLRSLRILRGELTEMTTFKHYNIGHLYNQSDGDKKLIDFCDEEIALKWLKYQMQCIQIKQVKQKREYEKKTEQKIRNKKVHNLLKNIEIGEVEDVQIENFNKIEQILEHILLSTNYDNFSADFEEKQTWLILFYYLFDGKGFTDLSQLILLCDESTKDELRTDKLMTLYSELLHDESEENVEAKSMDTFINFGKLFSNNIASNFMLMMHLMIKRSNLEIKNEDIALSKHRINTAMKQCQNILTKLLSNDENLSFDKEAKRIQHIIENIKRVKSKYIQYNNEWTDIRNRLQIRIKTERYKYECGELPMIYQPIYSHQIIEQLMHSTDYLRVRSIFERYDGGPDDQNMAISDFRKVPSILNQNVSILLALSQKYFAFNHNKTSMSISWINWIRLCNDCNFIKDKDTKLLMQQLFEEICDGNKLTINCHIQYLKNKSLKASKDYIPLSHLSLNITDFVTLLLFVSDVIFLDASCKASDKFYLLFQQKILKIIHPKTDIICFSNMYANKLLMAQKQSKLIKTWNKCISDDAYYNFGKYIYKFYGFIDNKLFIDLLCTHTTLSRQELTKKCNECSIGNKMDFEGFYGIICWIGQNTNSQFEWISVTERISKFIDTL